MNEEREFCCKDMEEAWYSPCLEEISKEAEDFPPKVQRASTHDEPDNYHPVKEGEIYLYEEEMTQIHGKPLKFCPWCGKEL